jgi:lipoate-protein ligase A
MEYKDKNRSFSTKGNEAIDQLLCITEATAILSKDFNGKITNIALWILTNHEKYVSDIQKSIIELEEQMRWTCILTDKFIDLIIQKLKKGLEFEINRNLN